LEPVPQVFLPILEYFGTTALTPPRFVALPDIRENCLRLAKQLIA
jgi:hypothetical protein